MDVSVILFCQLFFHSIIMRSLTFIYLTFGCVFGIVTQKKEIIFLVRSNFHCLALI